MPISHQLGSAPGAAGPSSQIASLIRMFDAEDDFGSGRKTSAWPLRRRFGGYGGAEKQKAKRGKCQQRTGEALMLGPTLMPVCLVILSVKRKFDAFSRLLAAGSKEETNVDNVERPFSQDDVPR